MDSQMKKIGERIDQREEERQREQQKRKTEHDKNVSEEESVRLFLTTFNQMHDDIQSAVCSTEASEKLDLISRFDGLMLKFNELQKYLTDSAIFLPRYDLKQKQLALNSLQTLLSNSREQFLPKKKFSFGSKRKKEVPNGRSVGGGEASQSCDSKPTPSEPIQEEFSSDDFNIFDKVDITTDYDEEQISSKCINLRNIQRSVVKLRGNPGTIQISNIRDSTIICGPCTRSMFIDDCQNCTIVAACQQIRVHRTTQSNFYVHVTSKMIIEDCSHLKVAPYSLTYDKLDIHYKQSNLDSSINNWDDIDDFNWLVKDQQSPNWSILEDDQRQCYKV